MTNVFKLVEQTGRPWHNELVSFEGSFAPSAQKDTNLVLTIQGHPLPTQITDATHHDDGSVATCRAHVRVDLPADAKLTLTLQPGRSPAAPDVIAVRSDADNRCIEIANGQLAVRIPASGTYPAEAAPGPIMALRLARQPWVGQGLLRASQPVIITTTEPEVGPLFARWQIRMHYERRTLATFDCTLYTGEDFVRVDESSGRDSDLTFFFNCVPGLRPDRMITYGTCSDSYPPRITELDYARPQRLGTIDFHSGHHQMSLSWAGLFRDGQATMIGVVQLDSPRWTNLSLNRIHVECRPAEELGFELDLKGGRKVYAVMVADADRSRQTVPGHGCIPMAVLKTRYSELPLEKVRHWVLDWDDSGEPQRPFLQCDLDSIERARAMVVAHPKLSRAYELWGKVVLGQYDPQDHATGLRPHNITFIAKHHSWSGSAATVWVALGDEKWGKLAVERLRKEVASRIDEIMATGAYMALIIFDGRHLKLWLQTYDVLKAGGFIDEATDRQLRRDFAYLAYMFDDEEFFPKWNNLRERNDPEGWRLGGLSDLIGESLCPPNFVTEYFTSYGMMGCCFRTHPMAAAWRKEASDLLERQLDVLYYDGGAYLESPNYHALVLIFNTQLAIMLRRIPGERDFFQHPRFHDQYDWFVKTQTPLVVPNDTGKWMQYPWLYMDHTRAYDPQGPERLAFLPGNGNSGISCSDISLPAELAIAAAIMRDSDPELAGRCMTTWRRAGRPIANDLDPLTFLLVADVDQEGVKDLALKSTLLTGTFVTFRANVDTPREVMVLNKCGTSSGHNDLDEGGFTIWAFGSPIASDFGYFTFVDDHYEGCVDTWKHNCVEFDGKSSGYASIEHRHPPVNFVTTDLADLLVTNQQNSHLRDLPIYIEWGKVPGYVDAKRYTMFVKPGYLLVFDSIQVCPYRHRWRLHAQANEVAIDSPRARFTGRFGVDLLAHFITPEKPKIEVGAYSVQKHIVVEQARPRDWRVLVAPLLPGEDLTVQRLDSGRVIRVGGKDFTDTVMLAHFPFEYQDDQVSFRGKAGIVRRYADGRVETSLLDGEELKAR